MSFNIMELIEQLTIINYHSWFIGNYTDNTVQLYLKMKEKIVNSRK